MHSKDANTQLIHRYTALITPEKTASIHVSIHVSRPTYREEGLLILFTSQLVCNCRKYMLQCPLSCLGTTTDLLDSPREPTCIIMNPACTWIKYIHSRCNDVYIVVCIHRNMQIQKIAWPHVYAACELCVQGSAADGYQTGPHTYVCIYIHHNNQAINFCATPPEFIHL